MQTVEKELAFDELVDLYKRSPEEFEAYRTRTIEQHIARLSEGKPEVFRKLNALQWKLTNLKRHYKDPMAWNWKLAEMLHEHCLRLRDAIRGVKT